MKLKNILLAGLGVMALASCNDFLEVEAPSSYTEAFVFGQKSEIQRALNGVYAQAIVNNLYGDAYQNTFIYNSDVDMKDYNSNVHQRNTPQRLDCDAQSGSAASFFSAAYSLIENCNRFIHSVENSPIYDEEDSELMQWLGEAKCLRAMAYHDLVVMYGDVPFSLVPASQLGGNYAFDIADRQTIQDELIKELLEVAPKMSSTASVTVEHCSKEFAYGLAARIALTAGGYSLRPDKANAANYGTMQRPENYKEYYRIAMEAADQVISAGTHSLSMEYQDVFVSECNYKVINNDDPIFELPFARKSTGNTGYIQGPTYSANEGKTVGQWGECNGGRRLNAFYRFLFRTTKDAKNKVVRDRRCEFLNGMWYYSYFTNADGQLVDSVYIRNDRTVHNNKWSKLWTDEGSALGSEISGGTGINFPYMRYADILLMYAEAANEVNEGPTDKAIECLTQVHARAFEEDVPGFIALASESKDAFLKAVLDERKWEFAGENIRWRDLVRNNMYAEELVYSFLRYYSAGQQNAGSTTGFEDKINQHDGYNVEKGEGYIDRLPGRVYYHPYSIDEPITAAGLLTQKDQFYGYRFDSQITVLSKYPLQKPGYQSLRIYNAYESKAQPVTSQITKYNFVSTSWNFADFYQWGDANTGLPNDYCKYSFFGYVRGDANGNVWLIRDGAQIMFEESYLEDASKLPPVRYILPYPQDVIKRSEGKYRNYYGY